MKTYQLKYEQLIPISLEKAWDFFSSPLNLEKITPPEMGFVVTSDYAPGAKIYPGMIITYTVKPLFGIRLRWMTEITHVKENEYFVDEQRFGPYALWHHQHHFKEVNDGVMMTDIVNYAIPYGFIGRVANDLTVNNKLQDVFEYRRRKIEEMWEVVSC